MQAEHPNTEPGPRTASQRREPLAHRLAKAQPPPNPLASHDFAELRALRRRLGRGGLPSERTPEDDARIAAHGFVAELLRGLEDFCARVQRGERVRLVMREEPSPPGVIRAEFAIETVTPQE